MGVSPSLRLIVGAALIGAAIAGCFAVYASLPEGALNLSTATPTPRALPNGATEVTAPIESAEVVRLAAPSQYAVRVVAGLPNGCTQQGRQEVERQGSVFRVRVLNYQTSGQVCTQVYGTYDLTVTLGGGLAPGATYQVEVNDRHLTFTAQ